MAPTPHEAAEVMHLDVTSTPQDLDNHIRTLKTQLHDLQVQRFDMRVQGLAQELQDMILRFTITVKPADDGAIYIDETYKPPLGLQLNRQMRASFATNYYGGDAIFQYMSATYEARQLVLRWPYSIKFPHISDAQAWPLRNWLESLEPGHRNMISTIHLDWQDPMRNTISGYHVAWQRYVAEAEARVYDSELLKRLFPGRDQVLVVRLQSEQGYEWHRTDMSSDLNAHLKVARAFASSQ